MSEIIENSFAKVISFIRKAYYNINERIEWVSGTKKRSRLAWAMVIAFCFFILLFLNILTPMIADDFCYLFIYGGDYQTKITSLSDIVISQKNHYYLWGGRSVVHFIAQALLLLPPIIIDLLNTLIYMGYVVLIYLLIRGRKKQNSLMLFILINLSVWFLQPAFGDTILWITGSANYLWGTTFILSFILPYRFYENNFTGNKTLSTISKAIFLFLWGILAGWTNENTAIGMIAVVVLFLFYFRSNGWKIPVWAVSGLVGAVIGYLTMILAPGNHMRGGEAISYDLLVIGYRIFMHTQNFIINCGAFNLLGIIFLILFWYYSKKWRKDTLFLSVIFFVGVLVGVYSMVLSPAFPPRAWFGVVTFNIISVGILLFNLDYNYRFIKQIRLMLLTAGMIAFLLSLYPAIKDVYSLYSLTVKRKELVEEAKAQGKLYCVFGRYNAKTKFVHTEDPKAYEFMYGYYGIDIRFKD